MSSIDSTGLTIDRLADILEDYEDGLEAAFGENVKTDPQSVFGQIINITAISMAAQQELIQGVADSFNPNSAEGAALSVLVLLNGIERQEYEYSTVSLQCTATANGTTILAGSLVSDPATGVQVATDIDLVLAPSAVGFVSATAVEPGAVSAAATTLTQIDTPTFGWLSVTNLAAMVEGVDEETDTELRIRRAKVAERSGTASVSAIFGAVSDVDGVDQLDVLENNGTTVDANGIPPQHVWVIVEGGSDAAIAEAIFNQVGAGIGTTGSVVVSHYDPQTEKSYDIRFTRPSPVSIYIIVNLTVDSSYPVDGDDQVENALLAYFTSSQGLGDDVVNSRLYTPVNSVPGHTIDSILIGTAPPITLSNDISIAVDEIAVTDDTKIAVNS
jgi:uncharacterized phage protein gp47/JayE